ncbi:uncharacterized protein LOC142336881 [Convolutriloba macropyga]|uniref:uncharacterized protein LOC142336881 n=1 Tax=Convolutriloba macropyga TaxID=536237 RepID=UPI003F527440
MAVASIANLPIAHHQSLLAVNKVQKMQSAGWNRSSMRTKRKPRISPLRRSLSSEDAFAICINNPENTTASQYVDLQIDCDYSGFGCIFDSDNQSQRPLVRFVAQDGPAAKCGLRTNDRIMQMNGQDVSTMTLKEMRAIFQKAFYDFSNGIDTCVQIRIQRQCNDSMCCRHF